MCKPIFPLFFIIPNSHLCITTTSFLSDKLFFYSVPFRSAPSWSDSIRLLEWDTKRDQPMLPNLVMTRIESPKTKRLCWHRKRRASSSVSIAGKSRKWSSPWRRKARSTGSLQKLVRKKETLELNHIVYFTISQYCCVCFCARSIRAPDLRAHLQTSAIFLKSAACCQSRSP